MPKIPSGALHSSSRSTFHEAFSGLSLDSHLRAQCKSVHSVSLSKCFLWNTCIQINCIKINVQITWPHSRLDESVFQGVVPKNHFKYALLILKYNKAWKPLFCTICSATSRMKCATNKSMVLTTTTTTHTHTHMHTQTLKCSLVMIIVKRQKQDWQKLSHKMSEKQDVIGKQRQVRN